MGRRVAAAELEGRLRLVRAQKGFSQGELASAAGLTRQTVSAIENGSYVPNTAVALRLAQALDCDVEDLFVLRESASGPTIELVSPPALHARRLVVAHIGGRWVGYPLMAGTEVQQGFVPADALVDPSGPPGRAHLLAPAEQLERTALLLGCDPSLGILSTHLGRRTSQARLLWLSSDSQRALDAVANGEAHVAGSHLHDPDIDDYNVVEARQALARTGGLLVAFARWEQGLVVPAGNPKGLKSVADLARPDVRLVNREVGAGSRAFLDELLARAGVPPAVVPGYDRVAHSHMAAASAVASGGADIAIALRATALALGLEFVPLGEVRFDFIIPRVHLQHPAVRLLLELLQSYALRADLATLPGYDVTAMGTVIADVHPGNNTPFSPAGEGWGGG